MTLVPGKCTLLHKQGFWQTAEWDEEKLGMLLRSGWWVDKSMLIRAVHNPLISA